MSEQQFSYSQSASSIAESTHKLDLLDHMLIIFRHKKFIISVTLGIAVLTAVWSLGMKNIYTATTLIVVTDDDKNMMGALLGSIGGGAAGALAGFGAPTRTELYATMLKSDAIKDPLIDRFKLMEVLKTKYRTVAYKRLAAKTRINAGKKDGVLSISVEDKDPRLAADIANAYADELGKLATELNVNKSGKSRAFLESRLAATKADLSKAEDALKQFQSKHKMLDVPVQAKVSINEIAQLQGRLAMMELQLATKRSQFSDSSYEVKSLKAGIANLKNQIARLEGSGNNGAIPSVGSVPQLGQDYIKVLRDFKIQEALVELLTKQYEMAKYSEARDVSPVQVIQVAKVPDRKTKPARSKIVIFVTFLSFVFSVCFVHVRLKIQTLDSNTKERFDELIKHINVFKRQKA